jgi:hypothetical protein
MENPRSLKWSVFALVTVLSSPALATRGDDDYGLWMAAGLTILILVVGLSAIVHFSLQYWARRTGRKEGRFWLTLAGGVIGGVAMVVVLRLAPLDSEDFYKSSVPLAVQVALPVLGAVAGFFVLRRKRPS